MNMNIKKDLVKKYESYIPRCIFEPSDATIASAYLANKRRNVQLAKAYEDANSAFEEYKRTVMRSMCDYKPNKRHDIPMRRKRPK